MVTEYHDEGDEMSENDDIEIYDELLVGRGRIRVLEAKAGADRKYMDDAEALIAALEAEKKAAREDSEYQRLRAEQAERLFSDSNNRWLKAEAERDKWEWVAEEFDGQLQEPGQMGKNLARWARRTSPLPASPPPPPPD